MGDENSDAISSCDSDGPFPDVNGRRGVERVDNAALSAEVFALPLVFSLVLVLDLASMRLFMFMPPLLADILGGSAALGSEKSNRLERSLAGLFGLDGAEVLSSVRLGIVVARARLLGGREGD